MEFYFAKFPNIIYNDIECKDISRRVKATTDLVSQPTLFYPYVIEGGTRADQLAEYHFEDGYGDWMLYLTNGIIDPYYGWYLDESEFNSFIDAKYGSFANAIKKIKNYRMNWYNVDAEIPVNVYNNVIPENHKKYFMPVFGQKTKILSYKRREADWQLSTNQIIKINVTYNSNNIFTAGELVDIKTGTNVNSNNGVEVVSANSSTVTLKNVSGDYSVNNYIVGETSQANATINSVTYLANNIAINERIFWEPITYYDYENEKNERNKNLYLLNPGSYLDVVEDFRIKLQADTF